VLGLLECLLPTTWRKKLDLVGYIPTIGTKAKLILECKAIEQDKSIKEKERKERTRATTKISKKQVQKF
jgi:hypothetical protein